jgi:cytidyltransferase-like protein
MQFAVVSGFFNPMHTGHLDMMEAARERGDSLVVIVSNDVQAFAKKVVLSFRSKAGCGW